MIQDWAKGDFGDLTRDFKSIGRDFNLGLVWDEI